MEFKLLKPKPKATLLKLTTLITPDAFDTIGEIQRKHRRKTGKKLAMWKIVDTAILAYGEKQNIHINED